MKCVIFVGIPDEHSEEDAPYRETFDETAARNALRSLIMLAAYKQVKLLFPGIPMLNRMTNAFFSNPLGMIGMPPKEKIVAFLSDDELVEASFSRVSFVIGGGSAMLPLLEQHRFSSAPTVCLTSTGGLAALAHKFEAPRLNQELRRYETSKLYTAFFAGIIR